MRPSEWGPIAWHAFHEYALKYPDTPSALDKKRARSWYRAFSKRLPCSNCSQKYYHLLRNRDFALTDRHLGSRIELYLWSVTFHNAINMLLGKPQFETS